MSRLRTPVGPSDHILGSPKALVTVVEYLDYQCPHCARAQIEMAEVLERVGDRFRYVVRHFPLSDIHPQAALAAQAAEAAAAQYGFWQMHATLFQHQDALEVEDLVDYATALGLEPQRFTDELERGVHQPKVESDFRSGVRSGVNGTPTFFVDGLRLDTDWRADHLVYAIQLAAQERSHARP